jgi:hypothetical protein
MGVGYRKADFIEGFMELAIVGAQINEGPAFARYHIAKHAIIIALIAPTNDEHYGGGHTIKGAIAGIYVGGFGVVDIMYSAHSTYSLQTVFHTGE